jgi:hypothetical protein
VRSVTRVDDLSGSGSWLDIEDGLISSLRVTIDPVAARP